MATKYFPVGYGRTYDSSKNYTEQQLRDLATTPTGEYNEGIYNTVKSFEQEKTGTPATGVTPSINVVGQDSNPYQGSSGGKGSPSINISTPSISIPTPNTDQLNLTPNLDQDLTKIDVGSPNFDQKINTPTLNTDQDLTKISVRGLQESAVQQAGDAQNSLIQIGTDIQAGAVDIGKAGQEALVKLGSDAQEQAVKSATQISGGQSNPTLEGYANQATKGTESQINQVTTYVEDKVIPVINDVAKFYTENYPAVKLAQETVHEFEKVTPNLELLGSMDLAGGGSVKDTSDPMPSANLDAKGFTGNDDPFADIETSTTKADKLTEEERLRRIRRLMLNRYGREDTILTGAKDPLNRRRYASAL